MGRKYLHNVSVADLLVDQRPAEECAGEKKKTEGGQTGSEIFEVLLLNLHPDLKR